MDTDQFLDLMLENYSFEDVLEMFDLTPQEAFECLFNNGLIDSELLSELKRDD